jgi:8-oxo-dGTP diphosphatase
VHRPRYDDWSFPKGKAQEGEDDLAAAVREVEEETGLRCRAGPRVAVQRYRVSGRPKKVVYYLMKVGEGSFEPGPEVDRVDWLSIDGARRRLTYEADREVLEAAAGRLGGKAR